MTVPSEPSREILVDDVLDPSAVKRICWIYCLTLVVLGTMLNACVVNITTDIPRKNSDAPLMKLIPEVVVCNDFLVKVMILKVEGKR